MRKNSVRAYFDVDITVKVCFLIVFLCFLCVDVKYSCMLLVIFCFVSFLYFQSSFVRSVVVV